jgi:hypothetical protein
MNDELPDFEAELRALRPKAPRGHVTAAIARELDAHATAKRKRGVIIAWVSGLASAAAVMLGVFFVAQQDAPSPIRYELVSAEQAPANLDLLAPVELADGSYARPLRLRWNNTTHWADAKNQTHLIDYRPAEQLALIPLETY